MSVMYYVQFMSIHWLCIGSIFRLCLQFIYVFYATLYNVQFISYSTIDTGSMISVSNFVPSLKTKKGDKLQ